MITGATQVINTQPRITANDFEKVLETSPALIEARQIFAVLVKYKLDPLFFLSVFHAESGLGTAGLAVQNLNPGNTRPPSITGYGKTVPTAKGDFLKYPSWMRGAEDWAARLTSQNYVYAQEGRRTIKTIIERASPLSDGNNTPGYIAFVVNYVNYRHLKETACSQLKGCTNA